MQDLVLGRDVQILLQGDFRRGPVLLRHQSGQPLRRLVQLRLHIHALGEDRLIGSGQRGLGRGEVPNVIAVQEGLIGPVRVGQFALESLALGLDRGRRPILKHFASIGQILINDRVQNPRRQGGIIALVRQAHDGAQRGRRHVQTRAHRPDGGIFLLLRRARGGFAALKSLDAQGANHALLDLQAVQDGGFRLGHLAGGRRRRTIRGAHARLIDVLLTHADKQAGPGGISLLHHQSRRRANGEQHGEDEDHHQQFAEQQRHDVHDAVSRSGCCIGCRTHEPGESIETVNDTFEGRALTTRYP